MAYFNSWEDLRKQPYYADLSDDEIKELWESFKMDPATALRVARNTAHNRQEANKDKAIEKFYQTQDALDRNFNPESYAMRRSGLGKISMPVGGRAGMANLHRPQYIKDMNQSINADDNVLLNKERLASANTLEAERNETVGWLKGSEQHRAKLESTIADYDRQIAKLQAEIAMSEAGDPMYDLAVMRMIMDNDMSLMNDIRGRIGKRIDQEFQMKQKKADQEFQHNENELNRKNTLEVAKMNREEQKAAKQQDLDNAYNTAAMVYQWAREDAAANPEDKKLKRELAKAKELYVQAAKKAGRDIHFEVDDDLEGAKDFSELFSDYGVEGMQGLSSWLEDLKKRDSKAYERELRNLKARGVSESDLGLSGAEAKKINAKNTADDKLKAKIKSASKSYGKGDAGKEARDKAWNNLPADVKPHMIQGYNKDTGEYVIKPKKKEK